MVRRLALLACPEPVENMRPVAGGARCDRCDLVVRHTAQLTEAEAMDLFERVGALRVCVEVRVREDRVRVAGSVIAGLSLVVLPACAGQGSNSGLVEPNQAITAPICEENLDPDRGTRVGAGVVQFGLSRSEVRDVKERLGEILRRVESGEIAVF